MTIIILTLNNKIVKTTEEILEYNKMCVEFLGGKYVRDEKLSYEPKGRWYIPSFPDAKQGYDLKFNSDWNCIMEMIEAIEKKSKHVIMGRPLYDSFDISNRSIKFYFSPNNNYLLQLELKQVLSDDPWIHTMYKHHIIQQFDFKTKGKKEGVVEAINLFLIWYNKNIVKS